MLLQSISQVLSRVSVLTKSAVLPEDEQDGQNGGAGCSNLACINLGLDQR
jgi:hypothetical protein